ncbi:FMN-dependent NADH-azoreductase [Vibrio hannami]|nr:FMN-dependent NADH-azoreductase [Vibrio hannami]MDG3086620.1 FMN-dependent NADH-azoreductase [Vibrio hannami]
MAKVLFIKANSRPAEQAVSVKLYQAFLDSYKKSHPEDQTTELDLLKENLPYYDTDMINGMFKLAKGMELTDAEKEAAGLVQKYLDQFLASRQSRFRISALEFQRSIRASHISGLPFTQAGKTFKYTAGSRPVGLIHDKKVALLNARGGIYSEGTPAQSKEMSVNYVQNILNFWGVEDMTTIIVEGHNQFPGPGGANHRRGNTKKLKTAAVNF